MGRNVRLLSTASAKERQLIGQGRPPSLPIQPNAGPHRAACGCEKAWLEWLFNDIQRFLGYWGEKDIYERRF